MSNTLQPYLTAIRTSLTAAMCLENFSSMVVERHNKPQVEAREARELLLNPIVISRNKNERCLIEPSINSVRCVWPIRGAGAGISHPAPIYAASPGLRPNLARHACSARCKVPMPSLFPCSARLKAAVGRVR